MFLGEVRHQLDEKKRIRIPTKFKKELGEDFAFVKGPGCIRVYPKHVIESQIEMISSKLNPLNEAHSKFFREYTRGIEFPTPDNQGRIVVPKAFLTHAQIEKDVITIGADKYLEIIPDREGDETDPILWETAMSELSKLIG